MQNIRMVHFIFFHSFVSLNRCLIDLLFNRLPFWLFGTLHLICYFHTPSHHQHQIIFLIVYYTNHGIISCVDIVVVVFIMLESHWHRSRTLFEPTNSFVTFFVFVCLHLILYFIWFYFLSSFFTLPVRRLCDFVYMFCFYC